jgi:hypothetical protein
VRRPRGERDELGQVGGVEGVIFGVLVFVLGTLLIANAWAVVDSKSAASAAARDATRAFVESSSTSADDAFAEADAVARETIEGYGRDPDKVVVVAEEASLRRCGRVTIRAEYPVPLVSLPILGRHGHGFTATGRHTELVDPYQAGLRDRDSCPPDLRP